MGKMTMAVLSVLLLSKAIAEPITADQLRKQAKQQPVQHKQGISPADLRSMLGILEGKDAAIYYQHQGTTYPGIQLPDGTLAPAIVNAKHQKKPGCLANDGNIYPAIWQTDHLVCQLPKNENALIPVEQNLVVNRIRPGEQDQVETQLSKYSKVQQKEGAITGQGSRTDSHPIKKPSAAQTSIPNADPNRYIPPPRTSTQHKTSSYSVKVDPKHFGISFGTWASAELVRSVTNADVGEVEIVLSGTLQGRAKALPAQTILYGNKSFNVGTNRLDVRITRGITPDGEEIELSATVYADDKAFSGLSGVLLRNREKEFDSIAKNAALQTASVAFNQATPDNSLMGAAYDSVTQQALTNEKRYLRQQEGAVIKVFPQSLYIRIDKSF